MLPLKDEFAARLSRNLAAVASAAAGVAAGAVVTSGVGGKSKGPDGQFTKPPAFTPPEHFDFAQLMASLSKFSTTVEQAITLDNTDFMRLTALASVVNPLGGAGLAALRLRFQNLINITRTNLHKFGKAVAELAKWATVPDTLLTQADRWGTLAGRLIDRANQVQNWQTVPGWAGASANEYAAATRVQANALAELGGIMASSGNASSLAAALNMKAFSTLSEMTSTFTDELRALPSLQTNFSFDRTKKAGDKAIKLAHLLPYIRLVADDWARLLRKEIDATLSAPNLLRPGTWPSGNSAADITAADIGATIRPDNYYPRIS